MLKILRGYLPEVSRTCDQCAHNVVIGKYHFWDLLTVYIKHGIVF